MRSSPCETPAGPVGQRSSYSASALWLSGNSADRQSPAPHLDLEGSRASPHHPITQSSQARNTERNPGRSVSIFANRPRTPRGPNVRRVISVLSLNYLPIKRGRSMCHDRGLTIWADIRTEYNEFMELSEMRDQLADFETRTDKLGRRL